MCKSCRGEYLLYSEDNVLLCVCVTIDVERALPSPCGIAHPCFDHLSLFNPFMPVTPKTGSPFIW